MDFSGEVVAIIGGASGIGGAATRAFAVAGAKAAFTCQTSADEAERIKAECREAGHSALDIASDVRDPDAAAFECDGRELGPADILSANAGGILKRPRCAESTLENWQEAMALNVYSVFLATRRTK